MATHGTRSPGGTGRASLGVGAFRVGEELRSGIIATATRGPLAVQYTEIDGQPIVEGDIVLDLIPPDRTSDVLDEIAPEGVIIPGAQFRWAGGIVPYEIDDDLPDQARVTNAIAHWERNTRIRFVQRTAQNQAQFPDFVRFVPGDGCSSPVGRRGNQQNVTLEAGCEFGAVVHEIGHTVGLWHEQSREDRDRFVRINWENIETRRAHNFNQHITDGDDAGPYDYHSIMHYPRWAFSANGDTIEPLIDVEIGQRQGLSPGDCQAVRTMYSNLEPAAVFRGVQFQGSVSAGATRTWFTHSWPAQWWVEWTVIPTAPVVDGSAQLEWSVQVDRQSGGLLKYFIAVRNLTNGSVDFESRYDVLGWSLAFS